MSDLNGATGRDLRWVAARMGLSPHTVRQLARRRALAHYKIGRRLVFVEADVVAYMQRHRVEARPEAVGR
jgi:excisionase family DNA binding protein